MKNSRIQIDIQNEDLNIAKINPHNKESVLILQIELEDLLALPPSEAAYRIGGTILNLLRIWHPSEFKDWVVPAVFDGLGKDS